MDTFMHSYALNILNMHMDATSFGDYSAHKNMRSISAARFMNQ